MNDFWVAGDINVLDEGGIIYKNKIFYIIPQKSDKEIKWKCYSIDSSNCTKKHFDWVNMERLCSFCGVKSFPTRSTYDKAHFIHAILDYYGVQEIDSYPQEYSKKELVFMFPNTITK